jgi:hypothetical protein
MNPPGSHGINATDAMPKTATTTIINSSALINPLCLSQK